MLTTSLPPNSEQVTAASKAGLDNLFTTTQCMVACLEQLAQLNMNASRQALETSQANIAAAIDLKDPKDILAFHSRSTQPTIEMALNYGRQVYGILAENQAALRKVMDAQTSSARQAMGDALEQSLKNAPPGSEAAAAMAKSTASVINATYDSANQAMRQSLNQMEGGMQNAAKVVSDNVAAVSKSATAARPADSSSRSTHKK